MACRYLKKVGGCKGSKNTPQNQYVGTVSHLPPLHDGSMGRLLPLLAAASVLVVLSFLRFGQGVKGTTKESTISVCKNKDLHLSVFAFRWMMKDTALFLLICGISVFFRPSKFHIILDTPSFFMWIEYQSHIFYPDTMGEVSWGNISFSSF